MKSELVKERDSELCEKRGHDARKERFQVSASTFEPKRAKVWKSDMCREWPTQKFPLNVTVGDRGTKGDAEGLEVRHL